LTIETAEFPVQWRDAEEADLCWTHDRMHFPNPIPVLEEGIFVRSVYEHGLNAAFAALEAPVRGRYRRLNTYVYFTVTPLAASPEELQDLGRRSEQNLQAAAVRLEETWSREFLPEIQRYVAEWEAFDLAAAPMPQMLAHLDRTIARTERLWAVHFLTILPAYVAVSQFDELYRDLLGNETPFDAYGLLEGFDNKALEGDRALWELGRQARASPAVREALEQDDAEAALRALERSAEGRSFRAALRSFLQKYGYRRNSLALGDASWIEDPTPVIRSLQQYMRQSDRDAAAELAERARGREQRVAEARQKLAGYPRPVVEQFESLLKAAQVGNVLSEDHNYWIDYRSMYEVPRVALEFGRRLAEAGVIAEAGDVWHLTVEELRETARELPRLDRRGLAAERKAEMERSRRAAPPPVLGTVPDGGPVPDPVARAMLKFFGPPPEAAAEPNVLRGNAGSPGKARGRARVIRTLAEAGKLEKGDVLVAETTMPPWTPLFAIAAAAVVDTGGILCHCAVVAREYGIPAVVGVATGTARIRDGEMLEVDGTAGTVRILSV
jgi:pyruvate,water dikinase